MDSLGKQIVAELYGCDRDCLDDDRSCFKTSQLARYGVINRFEILIDYHVYFERL